MADKSLADTSAAGSCSSCDLDDIYYGSVRVRLAPVEGVAVKVDPHAYTVDYTDAALQTTALRNGKLASQPGEEPDVVVPCIPAREIKCAAAAAGGGGPSCNDVPSWPDELRVPLMKVPRNARSDDAMPNEQPQRAVASGRRSALIRVGDGEWYRLKGCGNDSDGFVVRRHPPLPGQTRGHLDIRGSAFVPTAIRENVMTSWVAKTLDAKGIPACNRGMGYYLYGEQHCPLGMSNDELRPACVVMRTVGDRRLGTHVLAGVELLLPSLLSSAGELTTDEVLGMFPNRGATVRGDGLGESFVSTAALAMWDSNLAVAGDTAAWTVPAEYRGLIISVGEEKRSGSKTTPPMRILLDGQTLADVNKTGIPVAERAPRTSDGYPEQWTNSGSQPMADRWKQQWDQACYELRQSLEHIKNVDESSQSSRRSVLGYLFARIGYECGLFLRELHALRTSWGTYQDGLCRYDVDEWHCNAHANNMVLIPEQLELPSFLAYLDLDMAFSEDAFVDVARVAEEKQEGTAGGGTMITKEEFSRLLLRESVSFAEVLAGGDASNGVPQVAKEAVGKQGRGVRGVMTALCDTLLLHYHRAYERDECSAVPPFDQDLHTAAHQICKLAVILMADFVA